MVMIKKILALFLVLALAAALTLTAFADVIDNPNPDVDPTTAASDAAGYYIVGTKTEWAVDSRFQLSENPTAEGNEYLYEHLILNPDDQFKIVYSSDGEAMDIWYPDGMGNNYGQNGEIAESGVYDIYFRPDGDGGDDWFYNCIYVELIAPAVDPTPNPPAEPDSTEEPTDEPTEEPLDGATCYYVVGTFTDWQIDEAYVMFINPDAEGEEFVFENLALTTEDQFKVVSYTAGVEGGNQTWYPDGTNNNYGQNGEIVTDWNYFVYFRPNFDGGDDWFYHCIYLEADAPTAEPGTEPDESDVIAAWSFDPEGKEAGAKLSEYGSSDGYAATAGSGTLTLSVDGENGRALEWSDAEYGENGEEIVPIMAAGKKNPWGEAPYIQVQVDATDCEGVAFTAYMAGSNKAPAEWQLSYSTDGENFTDIEDASFTLSAEKRKLLTAYLDGTAIPEAAIGAEALYLRLTAISSTTVSGGSTVDSPTGGEVALNYICVTSTKAAPIVGDTVLLGDADGDGKVTILDATTIQRVLAALPVTDNYNETAACVSGGALSILDATAIQRWLAALEIAYAVGQPIA